MRSRKHHATTASVEDDEVFHEDRLALRLVRHRLPSTNDATLDVLRNRDAVRKHEFTGIGQAY